MKSKTVPVSVRILDKDYPIACPADERDSLIKASIYLNDKMKEVKTNAKIIGGERIAIITALNIAHELLKLQENGGSSPETADMSAINAQLQNMQSKIEVALHEGRQLEF